jgi:hypothetical protein
MGVLGVAFDPDAPDGQKFPSEDVREEIARVVPIALATKSVTGDKLADGTVGTQQIANGAIDATKIANEGIATGNLEDGAVTGAKIANNTITADQVGTGVLSIRDINGNSVLLNGVVCSTSDYNALGSAVDPNTIYFVTS